MATLPAAQPQMLPLFYKSIAPLSWQLHPDWGFEVPRDLGFAATTHAIPLTVDEFVMAQRHYPVIFGSGFAAAPLALVGLAEGRNLFVDHEGKWQPGTYIPAYVRRYPFMLAKLNPDADDLSLCFDDASPYFGPGKGEPLFDGQEPTPATRTALDFCAQFEEAVARTRGFMDELEKSELLIEGEVTIQLAGREQPAQYRGFRMVDETKLREMRGDQQRKWAQSGMMGILYAHLFSLPLIREIYEKQEANVADLLA